MKVLKVDFQSKDAGKIFTYSLKETGFGVLENHPVNIKLLKKVYKEWNDFFKSNNKFHYKSQNINGEQQNGYYPTLSENAKGYRQKDLKEFYQYYKQYGLPNNMSNATTELFESMERVAKTLLIWVEQYTPSEIKSHLTESLTDMIKESPNTLLRIINYPPLTGNEEKGAVRAAAHGDINFLTVLPAATEAGLQVRDINQNWYDVETNEGNLVVNTGDMLSRILKNYYPSTIHRVVNPTTEEEMKKNRMSMPLFLHARPEVIIEDDFTVKQFLEERLREIGLM